MAVNLPEVVAKAWELREGPAVLGTQDGAGNVNQAYVAAIRRLTDREIVIADCVFHKTRDNILSGSRGSFLFITKDGKAYQIKGRFTYHRDGPIVETVKQWLDPSLTLTAAVVLTIESVYEGAEQLA